MHLEVTESSPGEEAAMELRPYGFNHPSSLIRVKPIIYRAYLVRLFLPASFADATGSRTLADATLRPIPYGAISRITKIPGALTDKASSSSVAILAVLHHAPFANTNSGLGVLLVAPYTSGRGESIQLLRGFAYESGRASQEVLLLKGGHAELRLLYPALAASGGWTPHYRHHPSPHLRGFRIGNLEVGSGTGQGGCLRATRCRDAASPRSPPFLSQRWLMHL